VRFAGDSIEVLINDPATGEPQSVLLDETHLQGVVRLMSYADVTVALLPLIIDAAFQGNYEPLAAGAEMHIAALQESLGFAMHNSVVCTEDAPWFPAEADADSDGDGDGERASIWYLGTTVVDGLRAICDSWPAGIIDADFKLPVASDRPALLLSGEHDPVTPPAYAESVIAGGLTNSRHIVAARQGHGIASIGCMPRLLRDFVDSADPAAVDTACLELEPPMPFFLSFQGPAP
jgi:pimeloyl-ACP methyl ester carboxylesterase